MLRLTLLLRGAKPQRVVLRDVQPKKAKVPPQRERKPTQTVVLNHLDDTVSLSSTLAFHGQQLWNATAVAREKKEVRQQQKVFVVGGESAIRRMWLQYGVRPNVVYVPDTLADVPSWCFESTTDPTVIVRCSPIDVNQKLLSAEHNDGFAAEFPMPVLPMVQDLTEAPSKKNTRLSSLLVLHKVLIPSNVGSMIRSASEMGFEGVVLHQCADPFSEKVARASDGTVLNPKFKIFRLDVPDVSVAADTLQQAATKHQMLPVFAVPAQEAEPFFSVAKRYHTLNASKPQDAAKLGVMLTLGSESRGLDELERHWTTPYQPVTIPMQNFQVTSINVAAAGSILMNYFAPQAELTFRELQKRHSQMRLEKTSSGEVPRLSNEGKN